MPLVIAMAGLPGSGKSALARELERRLGALRWDKDELRELLFPAARVAHDRALNDFCMELAYSGIGQAAKRVPVLILDGRPFTERAQRERAREAARAAGVPLVFVLCTAPMQVLRARITQGAHVAPDRDVSLLERVSARTDPFEGDEIRVDTSEGSVHDAAAHCIAELRSRAHLG